MCSQYKTGIAGTQKLTQISPFNIMHDSMQLYKMFSNKPEKLKHETSFCGLIKLIGWAIGLHIVSV